MKTRRVELRASPDFVRQLDDLAASMRCSTSAVIRRLVIAEHRRRFSAAIPAATVATPQPTPASGVEAIAAPSTTAPASLPAAPVVPAGTVTTSVVQWTEAERHAAADKFMREMGL